MGQSVIVRLHISEGLLSPDKHATVHALLIHPWIKLCCTFVVVCSAYRLKSVFQEMMPTSKGHPVAQKSESCIFLQPGAKKILLSTVKHVPSWQLGCPLAVLDKWVGGRREIQTRRNFFSPHCRMIAVCASHKFCTHKHWKAGTVSRHLWWRNCGFW